MHNISKLLFVTTLFASVFQNIAFADDAQTPPNVVLIFMDDMGYADIGSFGATAYDTPNLDRLAKQGRRFTDFVTSSAVCSASRAALLTGCYHRRVGISGALFPKSKTGLNPDETTLAEVCKSKGYATACFGKWHLGHHRPFLPLQHGFDEYFGLPYSNDMWPHMPDYLPASAKNKRKNFPPLPLFDGNEIIDEDVDGADQAELTVKYTERSVAFIEANKEQPFFLYLPHTMVHTPLYVSKRFEGKSKSGLFGDVMMEVDWSVGQVMDAVDRNGLSDNTLIIFTSDNGPWLTFGDHAGSAAPLREGKQTMFEGGYRVPTVMRWTGKIQPDSVCDQLASTIDILPTVANLIGADQPMNKIDGLDISELIFGDSEAESPRKSFYCYFGKGQLHAVRDGRWKLHFPHGYQSVEKGSPGNGGLSGKTKGSKTSEELYDLKNDPGERNNVLQQHPEIVQRLEQLADQARNDLGDKLTKVQGNGSRPAGTLEAVGSGN
ncbi:sulfatase [bacterium]|nr:sulfatase [bacterium]